MISVKDISLLDQLKTTSELESGAGYFWPEFCSQAQQFLAAEQFFVFAHKDEKISRVAGSSESSGDEQWLTLTRSALQHKKPILHKKHGLRVAQKVVIPGEDTELILVAGWSDSLPDLESERLFKFRVGAQIPEHYQRNRTLWQVKEDVSRLTQVLELTARLQEKAAFSEAALECCNFLASVMKSQVALGWLNQDQVVLVGVNHQPNLIKGSGFSNQLEQVMTETFAFGEEISLKAQQTKDKISEYPEHQRYLDQKEKSVSVLSVPISLNSKIVGVIFLERELAPFQETDMWLLRLFAEHIAHPLLTLHQAKTGIFDRLKTFQTVLKTRAQSKKTPKDLGVVLIIMGVFSGILLFPLTYRVEANFILKTDTLKVLTSPFDGYLTSSDLRSGDAVSEGDIVAELDTRELLLERAESLADMQRLQREANKARASNALADMQIALAQVEQARSRLDKVQFRIEGSKIKAPFDSVLVEGDLAQLSGSPVRQGDVLVKLASLRAFYFELEADERVIQDLSAGMLAEIRFVTRPDERFTVRLDKIIPVAQYKEGTNVFRVRASFNDVVPVWWRPGMSGLAKVDAGDRPLFWLLFHNLIDSFRMKFWW